ncbi:MAG: Hsp20/alpha crystallin family protein [Anaerolineae bacterium]
MSITDLIPWRRERRSQAQEQREQYPMETFQRDMNRLFDEFFGSGFGLSPWSEERWGMLSPRVDVSETGTEVKVAAELPGLDKEDIELSLDNNVLTLSGEKRHEKEEERRNYYRSERAYGAFYRRIPLPAEVDAESAEAVYKNGVLTVTLQKTAEAKAKRITVKHE